MVDSANSAVETPSSETPTAPERGRNARQSQVEEIGKLLRGEEPDDDEGESEDEGESHDEQLDDDDGDGSDDGKQRRESGKRGKPKSLDDLAERSGVEVADLYAIKVAMPDGQIHTIGELKDLVAERDAFEVGRLEFEESKTKREAEFIRANAELTDLINLLPRHAVKPELIKAVKDRQQKVAQRERGQTLNAIPEWLDESRENEDRGKMREHLSQYGFPANYLDQVIDHRSLKYIRDNWQRQQRIERALAAVKKTPGKGQRPTGRATKPTGRTDGKGRGKERAVNSQVRQVADLLRANQQE